MPNAKIYVLQAGHCTCKTFSSNGSFGLCFLQWQCVCFAAASRICRRCWTYWSMILDTIRKAMFGACPWNVTPIDLQQEQGQGQDIDSLASETCLEEVKPWKKMLLLAFCSKPHWLFVCKPALNGFCFKLGMAVAMQACMAFTLQAWLASDPCSCKPCFL